MRRPTSGSSSRGSVRRALLAVVVLLASAGIAAQTLAQTVRLQLESGETYADLPFVLVLSAEGFDENPTPEAPELSIEGCRVWFLGTSPNVSTSVRIINGRMSESRRVTFTFRYRIEAPKAGTYNVPPLTVTQGGKSATTRAASFPVRAITSTPDMKLRLVLPDRPVWIGETFEVTIEWLLRRDVGEHEFVVPLFDLDHVQVQPGDGNPQKALAFSAGALSVQLPYTQDKTTVDGSQYSRLRFNSLVTVNRAGLLELEPTKVAAKLEVGRGRDAFGFRVPRYDLFKAEGRSRRLNVRPLPLEGRPESFQNAIGSAYSIGVQASRTVVQVGDPIELRIRIRGDGPLEGLSLPRLGGKRGLPTDLFSVADDTAVGVLDPEGNGKTFDVTVRIKSAAATEIPPLAFSYFDPVSGSYRTIQSDPIALSVAGSAVVGAEEVTAARPTGGWSDAHRGSGAPRGPTTLVGADLSLSAANATLRGAWRTADVAPWVTALYLLAITVLGMRFWQVRTQGSRGRSRELKLALCQVESALDCASPAREAAPRIVAAVRALARLTGREKELAMGALERLETRAFDPAAGERPFPPEQIEPVRELARGWASAAREPVSGSRAAIGVLLGALVIVASAADVRASEEDDGERVRRAREIYQAALEEPDRVLRTRKFGEAERLFAALVPRHGNSPELLTDWGNAALGSQEIGRAVLAYRRALRLSPRHDRAQKNLVWIRARSPEWLPRPRERGVLDSLFFWHHNLAASQRHMIGALAFAAGLILLAPWSARRTRLLRRLAIPLLLVWVATTGSAMLEPDASRDAVVLTDGTTVRSADSLGAPPSLANPLPAGTEVRILEIRQAWTRVALTDGTLGWVGSSNVESVAP